MIFLLAICLMLAPCGFGQLDSHTITITASRPLSAQADHAQFDVVVTAPPTAGLSDVVATVASLGLSASNLSNVSNSTVQAAAAPQQVFVWTFGLSVPFASMTQTLTGLSNLQQSIVKQNPGVTLTFDVNGTQASQTSQPCPFPLLVADARGMAQRLASAAGMTVGNLLALSDASGQGSYAATIIGGFVQLSGLLSVVQGVPPQVCTLTVKFQLIGF
jgi:hypothetical protein